MDPLETLHAEIRQHGGCGFEPCETATQMVPGEGSPDAEVMLVGEAPGASERTRASAAGSARASANSASRSPVERSAAAGWYQGTSGGRRSASSRPWTWLIFARDSKWPRAWRPSGMTRRGCTSASWRSSHGIQWATSSARGSRFIGGRALTTLVM